MLLELFLSFMKKILTWAAVVLTGLFGILVSLLVFGSYWGLHKWDSLDINEIIFQLQAPLEGTDSGIIRDYLLRGLLPVLVLAGIYIAAQIFLSRKKMDRVRRGFTLGCLALSLLGCIWLYRAVWQGLGIGEWIAAQNSDYDFIGEHYVDPKDVSIEFPEKKRNLIYIYLESIETSFADQASGGGMEQNLIPELTEIAGESEDFSGADDALNGGISYYGTTFTAGAIFGMSSGLPLKIGIGGNNMDTQDTFFPALTTIGDILQEEGYRQVFLCGSDATFGGRRLFFHDHGDFEIRDYPYAIEHGWIPEDYKEFWGYEDEKLFANAKETLLELAEDPETPFNLTMLTVDTHFPDGYECRLCRNEIDGNQYANAVACSSRQAAEFFSWIREQDFYENTTVIITGDHPTMAGVITPLIAEGYRRKTYTAYLNAAAEPVNRDERRVFSTMDNFPTTLAALGVKIEGDRLGLGTNLFSGARTLAEECGDWELDSNMKLRSPLLERLEKTDATSESLLKRYHDVAHNQLVLDSYDPETGNATFRITLDFQGNPAAEGFYAVCRETGGEGEQRVALARDEENRYDYTGTVDLSGWKEFDGDVRIEMHLTSGDVVEDLETLHLSGLTLLHDDFPAYLDLLRTDERFRDKAVFLAVKDEGTEKLSEADVEAMESLGLTKAGEIAGQPRISYVARIEPNDVREEAGYRELTMSGLLEDGKTPYEILSGGHDYGNHVSIMINGEEYAPDHRGMNLVVYDSAEEKVIDRVRFDIRSR